jgi:hypothetical protein
MRSPTSGIAGQLTATVTESGYLVSIALTAATMFICSLENGFTFVTAANPSGVWDSKSIDITGINWQSKGMQSGQMVMEDADLSMWVYALDGLLSDAVVSIWQCYADAPGEAEPLWEGRIGAVTKGDLEITCALIPENMIRLIPTRRVQSFITSNFLMAPGTIVNVGKAQWVIAAQSING